MAEFDEQDEPEVTPEEMRVALQSGLARLVKDARDLSDFFSEVPPSRDQFLAFATLVQMFHEGVETTLAR